MKSSGSPLANGVACTLVLAACGGAGDPGGSDPGGGGPAGTGGSDRLAFVLGVANDYSSGAFGTVGLERLDAAPNLGPAHSDAVARRLGGRLFIVDRFGADNLLELDPANAFAPLGQVGTGEGSNPQDVVALPGGDLLVSRLGTASLVRLASDLSGETGTVDLSGYADDDGLPEAAAMAVAPDGTVLVSCQRLVQFAPSDHSVVVAVQVDGTTTPRRLAGTNPFTPFVRDPAADGWLIGVAGSTMAVEAEQGIERLAPDGSSQGVVVTEEALGGSVTAFGFAGGAQAGWAIVNVPIDPANFVSHTHLVRFDLGTGLRTASVLAPEAFVLKALAIDDRDRVWVADATFDDPGVRVFDGVTGDELTAAPLDVGLPPSDIVFLP